MNGVLSRRVAGGALAVLTAVAGGPLAAGDHAVAFIQAAPDPADFVLGALQTHRVVLLGESHWVADEVELVTKLVARLPEAGTRTLAVEVFPAAMQERLDLVVNAQEWDRAGALAVLRAAEMPHQEYLEIIRAAWAVNQERGTGTLALVGLGPGPDWRETIPAGEDYESFMAGRVRNALSKRGGALLGYMGLHHAFSRYLQPESTDDGRAWRFMVRTGNRLWWEMGEALFVIGTHRPFPCRTGSGWGHCLAFEGAIDCASARAGRGAYGFDVAGSPFAPLRFDPRTIYAGGYPDLRFVDFADGWIWLAPTELLRHTRVIPLEAYAPDERSLAELRRASPFDGATRTQEELERHWAQQEGSRARPILETRWRAVPDWSQLCDSVFLWPSSR